MQAVFEDEVFAERNDHERILLAMYVNGRMTANGGQHLIYDVIAHKVNAIDEFLTGDGGVEHRQDESAVGLLELHVLEELLFEQVFGNGESVGLLFINRTSTQPSIWFGGKDGYEIAQIIEKFGSIILCADWNHYFNSCRRGNDDYVEVHEAVLAYGAVDALIEGQRRDVGMIGDAGADVEGFAFEAVSVEAFLIDEAHIGIGFDFGLVAIVNHDQADVEAAGHYLDDALYRVGFGGGHLPDEGVVAVFAGTFGILSEADAAIGARDVSHVGVAGDEAAVGGR